MDNPRAEKVAVVNEVRERLAQADAAVLTEYRGLTVAELAELRRQLAAAGGEYKVYKNTLVRLAVAGSAKESILDLLTGPTAIAFVQGDVSAVAKTLRDYSRTSPSLVLKGGVIGEGAVSAAELTALADLPSRDVLLAQFAGALAAPLRQLAGLMQALPRNLAYGLAALADQRRAAGESTGEGEGGSVGEAPGEPAASAEEAHEAPASDGPTAEAAAAPEPIAEAGTPSDPTVEAAEADAGPATGDDASA